MSATSVDVQSRSTHRLLFLDNIRVLLTLLVLMFHLMSTYAGAGLWHYKEGREDLVTHALGAWFVAVCHAFFIGLFFFISAYFVPGSYDRKGPVRFLKDRLIRLGIPLVLYSWIVRPLFVWLDPVKSQGRGLAFKDFITTDYFKHNDILGPGPLWFIMALLMFSLAYVPWRLLIQSHAVRGITANRFPSQAVIGLFALLLGIVTFLVRLKCPIGWNFKVVNLQLPFFTQYVLLFVMGLIAYHHDWFSSLIDSSGRLWLRMAGCMALLFWPLMLVGKANVSLTPFLGGWHWQAFGLAVWESFLCVSMCIGLVYWFHRYCNHQGRAAAFLTRNAYTVYLIHEVVIISVAYAMRDVSLYPLLKWVFVSLMAIPLCFAVSALIRKLPWTDRVL
ncbi:MAG: acyltransferase family protein [Phycisphaerae bacterium]|nr:acyltransferase family protein [Phycisphaerae bacterium]